MFMLGEIYKIHLVSPCLGTVGSVLSCHNTLSDDRRSADSTYVHVNTEEKFSNKWRLQEVGNNLFKVALRKIL
jgi:hypothetical protein